MWWVQPRSRRLPARPQAPCGHGVGVERTPPVGQGRAGPQRVTPLVTAPEAPVELPDVLPPPQHLPDESFRAGDRHGTRPVGVLGRADGVQGMQETQVERHREQGVCHRPVGGEHRVLVRAEVRQTLVDEVPQRLLRLVRRDGEPTGPVAPDGGQVHPIEVGAQLGVDVVFFRLPRPRQVQRGRAPGGGSRLAWSWFHLPPNGSGPSISTSKRRRCAR